MIPNPGSPADWIRHARSDLALASVDRTGDIMIEDQCFHAQQCAEKCFKAVLIAFSIEPPRTHDLEALLNRIPNKEDIPSVIADALALSDYASSMRYPGLDRDATPNDLNYAVMLAESVLKWATAIIDSTE